MSLAVVPPHRAPSIDPALRAFLAECLDGVSCSTNYPRVLHTATLAVADPRPPTVELRVETTTARQSTLARALPLTMGARAAVTSLDAIRKYGSLGVAGLITYGSYIISREDGPVDTIEDLVGRRIAYVDPSSASGWLFPAARLLEAGIHPTEDLDSEFYGNHERVVHAVMEGEVDAGATYSDVLLDHIREGNDAIRVVAKGALVPHDAYVLRPGLPTIIGEAVGLAMSEISTRDPIGREILGDLRPINGFVPVDDDHYERVRYVNERVRSSLGEEP